MGRSAMAMRVTASPSEVPGARLNDRVTTGDQPPPGAGRPRGEAPTDRRAPHGPPCRRCVDASPSRRQRGVDQDEIAQVDERLVREVRDSHAAASDSQRARPSALIQEAPAHHATTPASPCWAATPPVLGGVPLGGELAGEGRVRSILSIRPQRPDARHGAELPLHGAELPLHGAEPKARGARSPRPSSAGSQERGAGRCPDRALLGPKLATPAQVSPHRHRRSPIVRLGKGRERGRPPRAESEGVHDAVCGVHGGVHGRCVFGSFPTPYARAEGLETITTPRRTPHQHRRAGRDRT